MAAILGLAVTIAAVGRGAASGVLAPASPGRRLLPLSDAEATSRYRHVTWGVRALGVAVFVKVLLQTTHAPHVLATANDMLFATVVAGLLIHLLLTVGRADGQTLDEDEPRTAWLRGIAWAIVAGVAIALVAGYAGLGYFLAERTLTVSAVFSVAYLLLVAVDSLFTGALTSETPRARAIAANIGFRPRRIGLLGTLLSAGIRLIILLAAVVLVIGPWEVTAADFLDSLGDVALGFKVGGITISAGVIVSTLAVLIAVVLVTRVVQSWLATQLLPRTKLQPSLQHSVVTIVGYAGVIAAIALALPQLGVKLENVALIAGALTVGIGFGLQSIVSNFVSGIILLAERPVRVGDRIGVGDSQGLVRRISVRATEIETDDLTTVIIPNSQLITAPVTNLTRPSPNARIIIPVRVAYGTRPDRVNEILLGLCRRAPSGIETTAPASVDEALRQEGAALRAPLHHRRHRNRRERHQRSNRRNPRPSHQAGIEIPHPRSRHMPPSRASDGQGIAAPPDTSGVTAPAQPGS